MGLRELLPVRPAGTPKGVELQRRRWQKTRLAVLAATAVAAVDGRTLQTVFTAPAGATGLVLRRPGAAEPSRSQRTLRQFFNFPWGQEEDEKAKVDEAVSRRFFSLAEGEGETARLGKDGLRSLLECTESFCLTTHWLPDSFVDNVYNQYAHPDGIALEDFNRLACDGLLLTGKLNEYEKAFQAMDVSSTGQLTRKDLGRLFAGLGNVMAPEELDRIVDEADIGHDGIDFIDFLGLARKHLDLNEVLRYFETHPKQDDSLPVDTSELAARAGTAEITEVHGEGEINAIVASGADVVVKLAFTWCRPCKAFWPKYQKYASVYKKTKFLRIVGNENESCKHYAREVLKAKISPMFAVYSKGELVKTWHGANNGRFIENLEESAPSARAQAADRETAVALDPEIMPQPK